MSQPSHEGESESGAGSQESGASSYFQILRSTVLIGGSSAFAIVFAIIRNKAAAVLVGPEGFGLMSLYSALLELSQSIASLGLQSSGVRQIAEAAGAGDMERSAVIASLLRKASLLLGVLGMGALLLLRVPVSGFTFGEHADAVGVGLLSLAVLLRVVSGAQNALLQGTRQIALLARANMFAAVLGTVVTVPLLYVWGIKGIVPSLVGMAAISLMLSWVYARRVQLPQVSLTPPDIRREAPGLMKLGLVFLVTGLLTVAAAYLIRLLVMQTHGPTAAGLYQAAWTVGGIYAGFVLQAMGADFYPRLSAVCNDNEASNRLVNEQAQVGMLLAGPGLLATLSWAPFVIELLYSSKFHDAGVALRWICLGMMLRIIAWPIGFIIVAKNRQVILLVTEVIATATHLSLAWWLTPYFGVAGAGAAFFGLYAFHAVLVFCIVRRMSGFRWSAANIRLGLMLLPTSAGVFALTMLASFWQATAIGTLVTLVAGILCLGALVKLLPPESLPAPIRSRLLKAA